MRARINIILLVKAILATQAMAQAPSTKERWKELRSLPFSENYPTAETTEVLYDEMLFH